MRIGQLESRARIWRPAEVRNRAGQIEPGYTPIGAAWVGIGVPKRTLASYGAGELPAGTMEAELHYGAPLQARDVLEVVSGPEAGTRWRAESVHHPRKRSTLAALSVFTARLPEDP